MNVPRSLLTYLPVAIYGHGCCHEHQASSTADSENLSSCSPPRLPLTSTILRDVLVRITVLVDLKSPVVRRIYISLRVNMN